MVAAVDLLIQVGHALLHGGPPRVMKNHVKHIVPYPAHDFVFQMLGQHPVNMGQGPVPPRHCQGSR